MAESDEFFECILILAVSCASAVAIFSSYLLYRYFIVMPLESISSIATAVPIFDELGVAGTADHLAALNDAGGAWQTFSCCSRNIAPSNHGRLMSRLVKSFETLNVLSLTDPLCKVGNCRASNCMGTRL